MTGASEETESAHCSRCAFEQLEALYQLNVEAKRYAEAAADAYESGFKTSARLDSLRKKALYSLKQTVLETLVEEGCVDAVRCHKIDGREYFCLYVGEFSFHSPVDQWDRPPLDAPTSPTTELDSFDADSDSRADHLSEREALERLTEAFESPNNHLPTPFVDRSYGSDFAGWSSLPGALEEGDRVDGRFRDPQRLSDDFLFEVGDRFQTREGDCRIVDRYHAWLTPRFDRSPLMPKPAYDVELDGELRETVRERRIADDWRILAESLDDPVPNVEGVQAEMAGDHYDQQIEFEIGDIVKLDPERDEDGPYYCRIAEASLSYGLIMVEFEPVGPTEEAPLDLSVEEFADDVVAVHDTPPEPSE